MDVKGQRSFYICLILNCLVLNDFGGPFTAVPYFVDNIPVKFRFMTDQKNRTFIFFKRTL